MNGFGESAALHELVGAYQGELTAVRGLDLIPSEWLHHAGDWVRRRGAAIAVVFGDVPENADGYHPHISIAYVNATQPADPVLGALDRVTPMPVDLAVGDVS